MASEEPQQRSSSGSGRSGSGRSRQNPQQQLSQIEKSVTHLLVATKQLLETLTMWSRGQAAETEVSDVYVRLGYEFNIACRAFNSIGVETQDLGPVPDLLRGILEETLSQEASQASLDQFLPRIRDIIINLLTGLKKKQSRLRQKGAPTASNGQQGPARQVSIASTASNETTMTQSLEDAAARQQNTRSYGQRHGSGELNGPDLPPRTTSVQSTSGRQSPRRDNFVQNGSMHRAREPSRETLNSTDSSVSSTTLQNAPVIAPAPYPADEKESQQSAPEVDMPPPPPPPPPPKNVPVQKDALAALQRGGDLERRASRRFSAYQIQKHLGTANGVPMIPPAQNSPIPNRGRDAQESINAVRTRSTYLHNRQRSAYRAGNEASPLRNETRKGLDTHVEAPPSFQGQMDNVDSPNVKTPEDKLGSYPFPEMERAEAQKAGATVTGPVQDVLSLADGEDRRQDSMMQPKTQYPEAKSAPAVKTPTHIPQQFIPDGSPQSGKELTLFLQYKSKIKKFVLPDAADLTIARLQLAFIEKFNWNTQNNGVDLPEIYVQDHVSGVRHELEDLGDIKERSVLVLNVEALDEVKRHFDDGMGGLRRVVEGIRSAVNDQQSALQLVSDRQQETAKEIASLAAAPPARTGLPMSTSRSSLSPKGAASQLDEVQSLRRDLAVVRQTYQSFVADVNASMGTIRTKASSIKTKAEESKVPNMPAGSGRAYVNNGKKNLQDDSERIVTSVDDLQDIVEDLRKDVVTRGVRPLPRQLETVSKEISAATASLKKLKEFLKREKPVWTKIWEKELQVVCDDRDLLTMQEELCVDLEDDLEKAAATFALVEQATRQQSLENTKGAGGRTVSKGLNPIALDRGADPLKAKDGVLGEVKALRPNHESRLEAIERAEKARQKELEERRGGEFQKELGSFVEEGKLKKSGGVDEVERLRKAKDERARKEIFERQSARAAAAAAKEAGGASNVAQETTEAKSDEVKDAESIAQDPMEIDAQASQEYLLRVFGGTSGPDETTQPAGESRPPQDAPSQGLEAPDRDDGGASPFEEFVEAKEEPPTPTKFGKHIQKRQLDIPEYAASFVDYKALKKLIKKLSATPIIQAQSINGPGEEQLDSQASLQANKATFFFRLERELEKVNIFYLQKEAELKLRLRTLLDRKKALQARAPSTNKKSSIYVTLDEGFRLFNSDLDKLQQFVEINQTAFSKILKKWDKTSKSRTKELYLSRAVEVQPCFNRDVISDLSDQSTTSLLELGAWAEGENIEFRPAATESARIQQAAQQDESDVDGQIQHAVTSGNMSVVLDWISRIPAGPERITRVSRVFLSTVNTAPLLAQQALLDTSEVDVNFGDEINERTCLHELAISGRLESLGPALKAGAQVGDLDVYGRIPIHYACMHGHVAVIEALVAADNDQPVRTEVVPDQAPTQTTDAATHSTVNGLDLDNFTPLIHAIVHNNGQAVKALLHLGARVDPASESDHIPLNLACQYGSVAIVDLLLQYKPQILPDAEGLYPQHLVPRSGRSSQILLMLRNYGADLDQPDKLYQWTPIFHAASEGHLSCLETLVQCGVNVNALDEKDLSAMYYAAWEGHLDCLRVLEQAGLRSGITRPLVTTSVQAPPSILASTAPLPSEAEAIPDLSLPPPIIPLRRYGHNFLDTTKTFIVISFDTHGTNAIEFYGDNKYPAARLTISSKSSDLIPRNIALPIQDDCKVISFQIENLETFSIDFDIYPTFGSKVIARAAASSRVFTSRSSSSGSWHLELFDPRLRAIGRLSFHYQVVTPFHGIPMEITQFATYWKATSQISSQSNGLITGSSLSGDYLRVFVQTTRDLVPVLFPQWAVPSNLAAFGAFNDLINRLTFDQLRKIAQAAGTGSLDQIAGFMRSTSRSDLKKLAQGLASSCSSLREVLQLLPPELHLDLHIVYPTKQEEDTLHLGPTPNMNTFIDSILTVVFEHATQLRGANEGFIRSIVFSSFNPDICTALNWKQPNYPVLLCNNLGDELVASETANAATAIVSSGRQALSVKEAVRVAQSNNFMGLICSSRLLQLVPALAESIKVAGLVLITDVTDTAAMPKAPASSYHGIPDSVDGMLEGNSILRFNESIDM